MTKSKFSKTVLASLNQYLKTAVEGNPSDMCVDFTEILYVNLRKVKVK